jgi:FkbM family methyltransferase
MASTGFLYRRVARFVPCVFPHVGTGRLSLQSKYDIASLRDVFMSTHYWRAFEHMIEPPKLVVDLGAHCGHFSLLCHVGLLERFGIDPARYILIEALPELVKQIGRVVEEAGFAKQVQVVQGLVGQKEGTANFHSDPHNLLSSRVGAKPEGKSGANSKTLAYRDLDELVPAGSVIDLLKIDIEGSEFDLMRNYRHVIQAAKLLLIEVHGTPEVQKSFEQDLAAAGFAPLSPSIVKETERLICYGRVAPENNGGRAHASS